MGKLEKTFHTLENFAARYPGVNMTKETGQIILRKTVSGAQFTITEHDEGYGKRYFSLDDGLLVTKNNEFPRGTNTVPSAYSPRDRFTIEEVIADAKSWIAG
jgi:hypothetical protein